MTRVFVLGSNSFGGASFVNYAMKQGWEVYGVSRSEEVHPVCRPYLTNQNIGTFTYQQMDVNNDLDAILGAINAFQPDYVADFAGQGMVAPSWNWPEQWYETNIVSKVKLHNALRDLKSLKRYVRVSTPEVFGDCDGLIDETQAYNPSTPYAVSHAAIDMSLMAFYRQWEFPVVLTRFANFYGPGQQLYRIVPKTIICALSDQTLMLHGGGHSTRAFIHGHDVASGIFKALTLGKNGEAYHFTTDPFVTIRELVEKIAVLLDRQLSDFAQETEDRPGKDKAYLMTAAKAERELGWKPEYTLDQGLEECINWVRDNLETIKTMEQNYVHKA
ncbi:GDP-mannose 4,6-dehydratase [Roseibium marinum]|uniref:dTDP-glucose 4,6-dehydratase n=1 Tax=Roseibium marinum TaxID=281252 RepID=A0A2S3V367_9HYPH|nr:GDP-mannose 4,6-dehydratase [Roseibium marinum]POF34355.1 dTDP-glucose 4,6-dehydratase [Roseibium marinum]